MINVATKIDMAAGNKATNKTTLLVQIVPTALNNTNNNIENDLHLTAVNEAETSLSPVATFTIETNGTRETNAISVILVIREIRGINAIKETRETSATTQTAQLAPLLKIMPAGEVMALAGSTIKVEADSKSSKAQRSLSEVVWAEAEETLETEVAVVEEASMNAEEEETSMNAEEEVTSMTAEEEISEEDAEIAEAATETETEEAATMTGTAEEAMRTEVEEATDNTTTMTTAVVTTTTHECSTSRAVAAWVREAGDITTRKS